MSYRPISDYGIIGNMLSAALVSCDGSIDWCCLPRFDSPSIFAAILDDESGGRFQVCPSGPFRSSQAYIPDTNVLQTTFVTDAGTVTVTDFMPCYITAGGVHKRLPEIDRLVECTEGGVALEALFEPKPDYARSSASLSVVGHGIKIKTDTEQLALTSLLPFAISQDAATAGFTLRQGEKAAFILCYGMEKPSNRLVHNLEGKLKHTVSYWKQQAEGCALSGPWRETILRSYLTLHLLIYAPTGAIIAAPTTSLPEEIGGERNWDYRYTWLRDASFTINAFSYLGHKEEAIGFMNWLLRMCKECGPKTQVLYNIEYENPLDEQTLSHLRGYRDSRPVRIGNDAYHQTQLDVFGEVLEAAYNYLNIGGYIGQRDWGLLESFVDTAAVLWREPDNGIWEMRGGPFHFVHSKLMCWVAVDRGIKIAEKLGYTGNIEEWRKAAEEIREDILSKGWNSRVRAFTQHYDTEALDASNLFMPLFGFLPVSDERVKSTIERTIEKLSYKGLMRRYKTDETDDGLSGSEGAFLWCSFWVVRDLLRLGRIEEARALYEKLIGHGNHLGLLSEMVDPETGETLGNFPQALSHLAVIITGQELNQALEDRGEDTK